MTVHFLVATSFACLCSLLSSISNLLWTAVSPSRGLYANPAERDCCSIGVYVICVIPLFTFRGVMCVPFLALHSLCSIQQNLMSAELVTSR